MNAFNALYDELKLGIGTITGQLFELSKSLLMEHGNFLPHAAAMLTEEGQVILVAGAPESPEGLTNFTEVLPLLHAGPRHGARERSLKAVGVAENVTVTLPDQKATQAIKVLFEHKRGLTIGMYLPFKRAHRSL